MGELKDVQTEMLSPQVALIPGTDKVLHDTKKYYSCQKMGHYANKCPIPQDSEPGEDVQLLMLEGEQSDAEEYVSDFVFLQNSTRLNHILVTWVLLNSCSTLSVFPNKKARSPISDKDREP